MSIDDDYQYAKDRLPGRLYVSEQFKDKETGEDARFAHRVFPNDELLSIVKEQGEVILRSTYSGLQQVKVKFLENGRKVPIMWFQRWNVNKGWPIGHEVTFYGSEIPRLLEFLWSIEKVHLPGPERFNRDYTDLRLVHMPEEDARQLLTKHPTLIAELARTQVTTEEITALGFRRAQLERFRRLLEEPEFMQAERLSLGPNKGVEDVWQAFFEKNQWIFGYGLSFVFTTGLNDRKLEETIRGSSLFAPGRRVDAVMRTRAAISALCLVEIKRHDTGLLTEGYRTGLWTPSAELSGGVAQTQEYVRVALREFSEHQIFRDPSGAPTGEELIVVQPRSYLVVGQTSQFLTDRGVNVPQYRSFEDYRRNLKQPEILTFDELYDRARFIVEHSPEKANASPQPPDEDKIVF